MTPAPLAARLTDSAGRAFWAHCFGPPAEPRAEDRGHALPPRRRRAGEAA
ncbi:hypothetical protein OG909_05940 [Streptomyces sp. NBC_01754]|nr:hypothetical protein [Streptomyces sp. NBC_01754]WSC91868.1 hypothetical protein OG909_05940 [Streptomyces sp. NBC_01754]